MDTCSQQLSTRDAEFGSESESSVATVGGGEFVRFIFSFSAAAVRFKASPP
jgi:hypothetical protein